MNGNESSPPGISKVLTGIEGFDQMTQGGLPDGCVTLLIGEAGSGKTVFSLQMLVNGATLFDEAGLFVAFEESSHKLLVNAASFQWSLAAVKDKKVFFMDAMPPVDTVTIGEFDLAGMLAVLTTRVRLMNIKRIVLDSLDVLLHLMPDMVVRRREINRLHAWILANKLTAVITAKFGGLANTPFDDGALQFLPFIVDCAVALTHKVENGYSQRRIRIMKYRGSSSSEDETPFTIGRAGLEIAVIDKPFVLNPHRAKKFLPAFSSWTRILGGGVFRGLHHADHRRTWNSQDYVRRRLCRSRFQARRTNSLHFV